MTIRRPEDFKHYEVQLPDVKIHAAGQTFCGRSELKPQQVK